MKSLTLIASGEMLLGDTLMQTPAIKYYKEMHPEEELHWAVPDTRMHRSIADLPRHGVCNTVWFGDPSPGWTFDKRFQMHVPEAGRHVVESGYKLHIAQGYAKILGLDLPIERILPLVIIRYSEIASIGEVENDCLLVSPRSTSILPLAPEEAEIEGSKVIRDEVWFDLIDRFLVTGRVKKVKALIPPNEPQLPGVENVCMPLRQALIFAYKSCLQGGIYAGLENGFTHAMAGLKVPTFCVYPRRTPVTLAGYSNFPHYHAAPVTPYKATADEIWGMWKDHV